MANIIVKRYEGYNRAMGKYITSKEHYEKEMIKGGYIPYDKAQAIAEKRQKELHKDYNGLSKEAMDVCRAAQEMGDRKTGQLKASDRLIDGMKKAGVSFNHETPQSTEGGFSNE